MLSLRADDKRSTWFVLWARQNKTHAKSFRVAVSIRNVLCHTVLSVVIGNVKGAGKDCLCLTLTPWLMGLILSNSVTLTHWTNGTDSITLTHCTNGTDSVTLTHCTNETDSVTLTHCTNGTDSLILAHYTNGTNGLTLTDCTNGTDAMCDAWVITIYWCRLKWVWKIRRRTWCTHDVYYIVCLRVLMSGNLSKHNSFNINSVNNFWGGQQDYRVSFGRVFHALNLTANLSRFASGSDVIKHRHVCR